MRLEGLRRPCRGQQKAERMQLLTRSGPHTSISIPSATTATTSRGAMTMQQSAEQRVARLASSKDLHGLLTFEVAAEQLLELRA
jgi:hypothetical protein